MRIFIVLCVLTSTCLFSMRGWAEAQPVSGDEQALWLRWLIPFPKQIAIATKLTLPVADIGVKVRENAGDVEKTAAEEIRALLKEKAGGDAGGTQFKIVLGVCDAQGQVGDLKAPGAAKLSELPNRDQAYLITPIGGDTLLLTALNEKGVYYAARTLCQLLESKIVDGRITIPLAEVLDWPDLEERGEWGGSSEKDILSMASFKMNLVERHVKLSVAQDGKAVAETDVAQIEQGRLHALKVVPIITHLDQLGGAGVYDVYPELRGKGAGALQPSQPSICAPCASDPKFRRILTDWMVCLANQRGVNDICSWLSEDHVQCGCDECRKVGQYALEAQCLIAAWREAAKTHPNLRLRILLTQGSYETNDKVLAECPPEVGITYYDGGRTYNSSRDPMIYPLLEQYAAQGRWLGCYPQLTASWRIVCPWSGPQFIQYRMQEFVDKKLRCLCGYATPDNRLYEFNILAAAEWSWNAHGRSPREFALAWATRRGLKDPEAAADWAEMLGPVGWDVYGSGIPYHYFFGPTTDLVKSRRSPEWGKDMFRYFPSREALDKDLEICASALAIATALGESELQGETKSIQGYLRMLEAVYDIADAYKGTAEPDAATRARLGDGMNRLAYATSETCEALKQWELAANQHHCGLGRFCDTLNFTKQVPREIGKILAPLGIPDPTPTLFGHEAGNWESSEFETDETITKSVDVSKWIDGPGNYIVEFAQGAGYNGLKMHRVALLAGGNAVAADEHEGEAKSEDEGTEYVLKLDNYEPGKAYAIEVRVTGVRSSDKPENMRGCNGTIFFRKRLG